MKTINKFTLLFACLLLSQVMNASVINSATSGSWLDGSTWEGGSVPASSDTVYIKTGHTVTYYVTSSSNLPAIEICKSLYIESDANFYASNSLQPNLQFNFRGNVVCDGTIDLGQTGPTVSGAIFGFIAQSKSFSGNGSAKLKVLQHWGEEATVFTVTIPNIKLSGGFYELSRYGTVKVASGTTIEPMTGVTNLQMSCGGYELTSVVQGSKFEILGKVTVNKLYLANRATSGNKSMITIKDGGELTVTNKITTRKDSETTYGGTGVIFTVEAGGKFNYPNLNNPLDYTNSSHSLYDPNLEVYYMQNSIINGVTTPQDIVSSISEIGNERRFYISEKQLIIPQTIEEISIYNMQGLRIYQAANTRGNVDLSAYSGLLIVQVKSDNIKRSHKIVI